MRKYKYALSLLTGPSDLKITGTRHQLGEEMLIGECDTSTYGDRDESFDSKVDRLGGMVITEQEAKELLNQ